MKKGDVINGYTILQDFTTVGGGLSKWTFAAKGGKEYFIKEFLAPTYPVDGSPGSAATKARKCRQCERFEEHHKSLMKALRGRSAAGGNLVVARDFFRFHTKYYKVTDKVDVASLQIDDIAALALPLEKRVLILRTVAHSLRILHQVSIVHGDLKPNNILIKETLPKDYTTKLIDFDNSYFSGKPPSNTEEVVGDMVYYAPETGLYIQGDTSVKPEMLQTRSDVFSLGLMYCQYLTGQLPEFDQAKYKYPYVAVNDGQTFVLGDSLPPMLTTIVQSMLQRNPGARPDIGTVLTQLLHQDLLKGILAKPVDTKAPERVLRGSLAAPSPPSPSTEPEAPPSRLRGRLLRRSK